MNVLSSGASASNPSRKGLYQMVQDTISEHLSSSGFKQCGSGSSTASRVQTIRYSKLKFRVWRALA